MCLINLTIFVFIIKLIKCENNQELYLNTINTINKLKNIKYKSCWSKIENTLNSDCENINDYGKAFMALQMTNCYRSELFLPIYICDNENKDSYQEILKKCVSKLSNSAYKVYTNFITNIVSYCFYNRQEKYRNTIEKLSNNLKEISKVSMLYVNMSIKIQDEIIEMQNNTLILQEKTINKMKFLDILIKNYSINVDYSFNYVNLYLQDFKILTYKTLSKTVNYFKPFIKIVILIY